MHKVGERGPGEFVGEAELASGRRRDANVVALQGVTCLVFSPGEPTAFAGRGADAQFTTVDGKADIDEPGPPESECIDVSEYVPRKMAAVAEHRTQYRFSPDILPKTTLQEMLGCGCFSRVGP